MCACVRACVCAGEEKRETESEWELRLQLPSQRHGVQLKTTTRVAAAAVGPNCEGHDLN